MPQLGVCNAAGETVGEVAVSDEIFGAPMNPDLLHQAVVMADSHRKRHAGNTKRRGDIIGSGTKIWRQKGTGRARHSDRKAPLFVGGAKAHSPHPRSGEKRMPRKMRRKALFCALSEATRRNRVTVIENLELERPRTKLVADMLAALRLRPGRILMMLSEQQVADDNVVKSCRNIANLYLRQAPHLNARDVLWADEIIFTRDALDALNRIGEEVEQDA